MTATTTEFPQVLTQTGFTADAVEAIADLADATTWSRERRAAGWAAFERIPMPSSRDERWRFTKLRGFKLDKLMPFTDAQNVEAALERAADAVAAAPEHAARFVTVNSSLQPEHAVVGELPDGVVVSTLQDALQGEHAEVVQRHWGTAVSAADSVDDKFVALNEATWLAGVFVYVPRNVRVELPIEHVIVHSVDGGTMSTRALVVLEEGAAATFVEEQLSTDRELNGFSNSVVELIVGDGAQLTYVTAQDYATPVAHFATHRVIAGRDAQVEWTAVGLGASMGKSRMEARLVGPGANVRLNGMYILDGRQQIDYDTQQVHEAPNASSDLAFKGVLSDRAHSVWRGIIDVRPGAQGTDSYQENRNLLLNTGAHADSIPGLQIEANEVRCTHGATISKVDPEQLFYLQARGVSREEATRTVVRGFLTPLLERVQPEAVREQIRTALWARLER